MKNNYLFLLALAITFLSCSDSDETCLAIIDGELLEVVLDETPQLINDNPPWAQNLNYPAEARENGIQGIVEIEYAVSETGVFQELSIKKDIGGGCGTACIEFLSPYVGQTLFHPGIYRDETVKVYKILPIEFKLP